ncbi:TrkH family potassium uptake protein [Dehalogenimonas etheniformans]|uniref:TrkH family potassium uptake protein n=1 Tax=Dehalogenimonas etheniformans TaxID=1536648 RepID=A0A2P5P767_9CHLR|nr:TrkH family potassium uptake protein [Dehalogenimonas etheniformans]PPD58142.1 TrkH family potassium uptake protein [Dehalogenimonas etheniformans]QNT75549.1 TrkH family potassium uptake protein [Dehalogenimonas etheniformans]
MNFSAILRYLGLLTTVIGATMMIPLLVAAASHELEAAPAFAVVMGLAVVIGGSITLATRRVRTQLSRRDAMVLVVGVWITATIFGALPYLLSGVVPNFLDAFFETMSGFTTTGATIFSSIADKPHSILVWRSFTQWLGGLGIITLFVSLFPLFGLGASRLLEAEAPGGYAGERLTSRIRDTARIIIIIYVCLTAIQILLLVFTGLPLFDAATIALSTVSTGGFAATNLSIESYHNLLAEIIIMVFMFLGGINFALFIWLILRRRWTRFFGNPELRFWVLIILVSVALVNLDLIFNKGLGVLESFRQSSFNILSASSTTGFTSANYDAWPGFSRSLILVLMVIGASAGSTAGGLKIIRLIILFKYAYRRILQAINPAVIVPLKIGDTTLQEATVSRTIGLTVFYFGLLWGGFVFMAALGLPFEEAISSVASCMSSFGPGFGAVGPYGNFEHIPGIGKAALCFFMLAGRLEIFALLVLFAPPFWRRY